MPLDKGYAILKGNVIRGVRAKPGKNHYSIHVVDDDIDYRIAVNIRSSAQGFGPDLEYFLDEDIRHPILDVLTDLPVGRKAFPVGATPQQRREGGALDFIRGNLFDRTRMRIIPSQLEGLDNDLNDRVDGLVARAVGNEDTLIYALGEPWGPETQKDKVFGFKPGNGVHNIHMNQGDLTGRFDHEDGVYQDGGLIFHFRPEDRFVAYFTKFQSQSWHTDDAEGHAQTGGGDPAPRGEHGGRDVVGPQPDFQVRIIAAMVNPVGGAPERETVTLLNTTAGAIDLAGWRLLDKQKDGMALDGVIERGAARLFEVRAPMKLSNSGGIITLLNAQGLKVHGVKYTAAQAGQDGVTITFG